MSDRDLIDALLSIESGLTGWEIDFIESLDGWLLEHESLTEKQRDIATKIYKDKGGD